MQEAAFYENSRVHEETPQKIFAFFERFSKVMRNEPVLAIFGSVRNGSDVIENSAVILKDRIEYAETLRLLPKMKTVSLEYLDQIYLLPEGNLKYVSVVDKSKSSVRFEIRASVTDTTAFYHLIKELTGREHKKLSKVVKCRNCGADCTVYEGEETKCEYCDTPVIW